MAKISRTIQSAPKTCQICLAKATGNHYEVDSCTGCKSFFKRVVIGNLKFDCRNDGMCYQNLTDKKAPPRCRACRYEKCKKVGMNPDRFRSDKNDDIILPEIGFIESQTSNLINQLLIRDNQCNKFRDSTYSPSVFPLLSELARNEHSLLSNADKYGPITGWPIPHDVDTTPRHSVIVNPAIKRWVPFEILMMAELCKTFDFYKQLCDNDKYFLLRDTCLMASNFTKSYYSYDQKSDKLIRPDGHAYHGPLISKPPFLPKNQYSHVQTKCLRAITPLQLTKIEFIILRAIVLANPNANHLTDHGRKILTLEREKYAMCLFHHVMTNSDIVRFEQLLNIVNVLEYQQKYQRDIVSLIIMYRPKWFKLPLFDCVAHVQ